jgi:hypothetical protein
MGLRISLINWTELPAEKTSEDVMLILLFPTNLAYMPHYEGIGELKLQVEFILWK